MYPTGHCERSEAIPKHPLRGLFFHLCVFVGIASPTLLGVESVRLVTLNTWLLNIIAKDIDARRTLIPEFLATHSPDIIGLQEVWGETHRNILIAKFLQLGYQYSTYKVDSPEYVALPGTLPGPLALGKDDKVVASLASSLFFWPFLNLSVDLFGSQAGSSKNGWVNGLLILSKFPIENEATRQLAFSYATAFEEGFVKKGALFTQIRLPSGKKINLTLTHLGARDYLPKLGRYHTGHDRRNLLQLRELLHWQENIQTPSDYNVLMGDFNFNFRVIEKGLWSETIHPGYALLTAERDSKYLDTYTRDFQTEPDLRDYTCGYSNPYNSNFHTPDSLPNEIIDYIFVENNRKIRTLNTAVLRKNPNEYWRNTPPPTTLPRAFSDHYGVLTDLEIS